MAYSRWTLFSLTGAILAFGFTRKNFSQTDEKPVFELAEALEGV